MFSQCSIKLTFELFCQDSSGAAMGSHEELLSEFGVVGYANESSTNLGQLVQMFACVVCNNGYERDLVLCDQYVASFQLTPGVWVVGSQVIYVCNVP